MRKSPLTRLAGSGAGFVLFVLCTQMASARSDAGEPGARTGSVMLPNSETAQVMRQPILPLRVAGSCPSPDPCEFGTNWRACEPVPVYRQDRVGVPLLRTLRANEEFRALGGGIELIAPGEVSIMKGTPPALGGGLALPAGSKILVYGPMAASRALYFDVASGQGWSPEAASDQFWWDPALAQLTRVPEMRWWVKVRLQEGKVGWLRLDYVPDAQNFPSFSHAEAIQTWNVDIERDDESPECDVLLKLKN